MIQPPPRGPVLRDYLDWPTILPIAVLLVLFAAIVIASVVIGR